MHHHNLKALAELSLKEDSLEEAVELFRQALELRPDDADTHFRLGMAFYRWGEVEAAIGHFQSAIRLFPARAKFHHRLGIALRTKGLLDESLNSFERALKLDAGDTEILAHRAMTLSAAGRLREAIRGFSDAERLQPNFPDALHHRGMAYYLLGQPARAVQDYHLAVDQSPENRVAHSLLVYTMNYTPHGDLTTIFKEHERWGKLHAASNPSADLPPVVDRSPDRKLRIGYVSGDFVLGHSVSFFSESMIEAHDRREVEVYCYATHWKSGDKIKRFLMLADHWRNLCLSSDAEAAERIRQDQIDILVDLSGHTRRNRLGIFARRPAPIQVSYLGYPNTTGVPAIDYRISDAIADPKGSTDGFHTEELVRLPGCFLCYQLPRMAPPVGDLPAITQGTLTLGSFCRPSKINAEVIEIWSAILQQLPSARLLLHHWSYSIQGIEGASFRGEVCTRIVEDFEKKGVAADRVEFIGNLPYEKHLGLHNRLDLGLDPFPYNGTTLTCEALSMGVPIVTLAGQTHVSRVGLSLLSCIGLPELAAHSKDEYIRLAVELANDTSRLRRLRRGMRRRMARSPLTDKKAHARSLENAYRWMWKRYCAAPVKPPQTIGLLDVPTFTEFCPQLETPETVVFGTGRRQERISGRLCAATTALIDGRRPTKQILEILSKDWPRQKVSETLASLEKRFFRGIYG